jgi:hypothetical protein
MYDNDYNREIKPAISKPINQQEVDDEDDERNDNLANATFHYK